VIHGLHDLELLKKHGDGFGLVDACLTPPFLIDQRVIVVREAGRLPTADVPRLLEVVTDPLPSTVLILVGGGGTVPAPLVKAVTAAGQVIDASVGRPGDRKAWLHEHLRGAPVKLDPRAAQLLGQHVGEDLGRVEGLLGALANAYGPGARISVDELEPYLGEAGNVPRVIRQSCAKNFYVSPFMDMALTYHFRVGPPGERVSVVIGAHDADGPVMSAAFAGTREMLSDANLVKVFIRHPLLALQVLGGIHWEALKLWRKGLKLRSRPAPPAEPVSIAQSAQANR